LGFGVGVIAGWLCGAGVAAGGGVGVGADTGGGVVFTGSGAGAAGGATIGFLALQAGVINAADKAKARKRIFFEYFIECNCMVMVLKRNENYLLLPAVESREKK